MFKANTPEARLTRLTLASMLWENQFYMDGKTNAEIIKETVSQVPPGFVTSLAKKARDEYKLRHVPLKLMRELARTGNMSANDLAEVIQRPDEMGEFLAMYWEGKKTPVSNQVKRGLAKAFTKFNEYQLAKWDKNNSAISIRDVMFLTHPKPTSPEQEQLFAKVANKQLETPDTWEVQLSGGADKAETFTRLMAEKKLGALAFLRNLRNMIESGVSRDVILSYGSNLNVSRVLPFRFIAAYRSVKGLPGTTLAIIHMLEAAMLRALHQEESILGKTALLVDVSGSMFYGRVSEKSDLSRFDAAAALAIMCRELYNEVEVYTFSNSLVKVDAGVRGFALVDALQNSQSNAGTQFYDALSNLNNHTNYSRLIVFTDEVATDAYPFSRRFRAAPLAGSKAYVINVASYKRGLDLSDQWLSVTGFSEAVLHFIQEYEKSW